VRGANTNFGKSGRHSVSELTRILDARFNSMTQRVSKEAHNDRAVALQLKVMRRVKLWIQFALNLHVHAHAAVGVTPHQRRKRHAADCIQISPRAKICLLKLFWSHEGARTSDDTSFITVADVFCQSEIDEANEQVIVLRLQHHVGGFDVTVNQIALVSMPEGRKQLFQYPPNRIPGGPALQIVLEGQPINVFHHEKGASMRLAVVIYPYNVTMRNLGKSLSFLFESRQELSLSEQLQRGSDSSCTMARMVDFPYAPLAEFFGYKVVTEHKTKDRIRWARLS
jgi:hypothetical protein